MQGAIHADTQLGQYTQILNYVLAIIESQRSRRRNTTTKSFD